jgi:hypothetical protein
MRWTARSFLLRPTNDGTEDLLGTLVEAEIAARDASNVRNGMRQAGFPVAKRLQGVRHLPHHRYHRPRANT